MIVKSLMIFLEGSTLIVVAAVLELLPLLSTPTALMTYSCAALARLVYTYGGKVTSNWVSDSSRNVPPLARNSAEAVHSTSFRPYLALDTVSGSVMVSAALAVTVFGNEIRSRSCLRYCITIS